MGSRDGYQFRLILASVLWLGSALALSQDLSRAADFSNSVPGGGCETATRGDSADDPATQYQVCFSAAGETFARGKFAEAETSFATAAKLAERFEVPRGDFWRIAVEGEASSLLALGRVAAALGRLNDLRPSVACDSCPRNQARLDFYYFAASLEVMLRRNHDALEDLQNALQVSRALHGDEHLETIGTQAMLVSLLVSMDREKDATPLHRESRKQADRIGLKAGPILGRILFNEVELHGRRLSLREREFLLAAAVEGFEKDPSGNPSGAAAPLLALADIQIRGARFSSARATLEKLFALHEGFLQHDPRFFYHGLLLKARLVRAEGNRKEANRVEREARAFYDRSATLGYADWTVSLKSLRD